LVGEREGWIPALSRAVFVANYAQQKDISDDGTLRTILAALGVDAEAALAAANAPETTAEQSGGLYTTVDTEQDLVDALEKTLDCPMISQRDLAPPRGLAQR
jgi:protein-disulfide isomerase-like protein with CxxC motif